MWRPFTDVLICLVVAVKAVRQRPSSIHSLSRREAAFDLLRLERALEEELQKRQRLNARSIYDAVCQAQCNDKLRVALDMVKAHTAFGSIGVPSVIDSDDLTLFCRFDAENDQCLRNCGYEIQFNMRDYVCKTRFQEMVDNLSCYARAAPVLKRLCGENRCGPYEELKLTVSGYATRCRSLVCDLSCTQSVLLQQCGITAGMRASRLLLDYTRVQVSNWIRDTAHQAQRPISQVIPRSCSRLYCDEFDVRNCTYTSAFGVA
ncbi:hypothetical protein M3Y98_00933600 [Aphelenchoides besseyi]|nr:hypothetical protein M3Y98_00933600 [Aphelenchoides besseyi]KAI6194255.1 hypothetical protein M3Y96_01105800 [Aphelenchoides besseyi]